MKWNYYYNPDRSGGPYSFRRVRNEEHQQLKPHLAWGASEPEYFVGSHRVPDLLLVLKGYPT